MLVSSNVWYNHISTSSIMLEVTNHSSNSTAASAGRRAAARVLCETSMPLLAANQNLCTSPASGGVAAARSLRWLCQLCIVLFRSKGSTCSVVKSIPHTVHDRLPIATYSQQVIRAHHRRMLPVNPACSYKLCTLKYPRVCCPRLTTCTACAALYSLA